MQNYTRKRSDHWNKVFSKAKRPHRLANYYHHLLEKLYQFNVPPKLRVLELGCGDGFLLAALRPALGVGIDFSRAALNQAKAKNPQLLLVQADAHQLPLETTFDIIILSDLINDLWDAQTVFEALSKYSHNRTRILLNVHSRFWQVPLNIAEKLGFKNRTLAQNWFTLEDIRNLFRLTDFELVKHNPEILLAFPFPILAWLLNSFFVKLWPLRGIAVTNFLVARPRNAAKPGRSKNPTVSIVIPARNEAGNIAAIFARLPKLEGETELIFVEGHSKDATYKAIESAINERPSQKIKLLKQTGAGKADAVWQGFAAAEHELLVILDADLSVAPEDLPRFYEAASLNKGEFINGSRLVYPMEDRAMPVANLAGNKIFSVIFTWLLSQPIKDTLCGTKVIWRDDYELLRREWPLLGTLDPFGDFDLLLGATKLNLKIIDQPIRYRERTYGETNIRRWAHGWLLLRITLAAARRLKFRV